MRQALQQLPDVQQRQHAQHREESGGYAVHQLVWFESTPSVEAAIHREKQIKNWKRDWKVALIEKANPEWADLYEGLL